MQRLIRNLVGYLLLAAIAPACNAQVLWRETKIGMSPAEVRRLVPEAKAPEGDANSLDSGAVELLRVSDFELLREKFTAGFYFEKSRLTQVTLTLQEKATFQTALRIFDSVSEALRAKYGPELGRKIVDSPYASAEATWLSGKTNIGVLTFSVVPGHLVFNISYQVRLIREANKL